MPTGLDAEVLVVGAGLSGLSCAFELAEAGVEVCVLEARPWPGGRTADWVEEGMAVESGFHRFRGIYRALPNLLQRAGIDVDALVAWQTGVELRLPDARPGWFGNAPRFAPGELLRGLLGNNDLLTPLDKLSLLPLLLGGWAAHRFLPATLDRRDVLDYAVRHGVTRRARERVLPPLTRGVFFRPPAEYSAQAFMMPLAFSLQRPGRLRSGVFRQGMTAGMAQPLLDALRARGAQVRLAAPVRALRATPGAVQGLELDTETLRGRELVLATAPGAARRLLRPFAAEPAFAGLFGLPFAPAVSVQLDLERPALPHDAPVFAPGCALLCFAEQSRTTFPAAPGRLSGLMAEPERWLDAADAQVLDAILRDVGALGLDLDGQIRGLRVLRQPEDFLAPQPGQWLRGRAKPPPSRA